MRYHYLVLLFVLTASPLRMAACSCFGPTTFCETLDPPYEPPIDPAWWIPDHIVLGVKLTTVEYGVDLKIVQDFSGGLEADAVIRVWGDCGLLCRMYNSGVADGDTVLWAIQDCDLSGNGSCGLSVEEPEHYQLSVCGVYWLGYVNGVISGPLYTEGAMETIGIEDFSTLINGCLSTGVQEQIVPEMSVRCVDGTLFISTRGAWSTMKELCVMDATGRVLHCESFSGSSATAVLSRRMDGLLLVRVTDGAREMTHRAFFN